MFQRSVEKTVFAIIYRFMIQKRIRNVPDIIVRKRQKNVPSVTSPAVITFWRNTWSTNTVNPVKLRVSVTKWKNSNSFVTYVTKHSERLRAYWIIKGSTTRYVIFIVRIAKHRSGSHITWDCTSTASIWINVRISAINATLLILCPMTWDDINYSDIQRNDRISVTCVIRRSQCHWIWKCILTVRIA